MKIAFCYPGQGVQQVGMAEGFVKSGEHYADMISDPPRVKAFVYSGGIGLKIAMNQNFIVSAQYAHPF